MSEGRMVENDPGDGMGPDHTSPAGLDLRGLDFALDVKEAVGELSSGKWHCLI